VAATSWRTEGIPRLSAPPSSVPILECCLAYKVTLKFHSSGVNMWPVRRLLIWRNGIIPFSRESVPYNADCLLSVKFRASAGFSLECWLSEITASAGRLASRPRSRSPAASHSDPVGLAAPT
jgi:hypothetical protein